jgi:hypothetical protein
LRQVFSTGTGGSHGWVMGGYDQLSVSCGEGAETADRAFIG